MKTIIYGSQYGTAREYAQKLSEMTGIEAVEYSDIADINRYETVVYVGALYAGSVFAMKKTLRKIEDASKKKIIIATVGLADPSDKHNTDGIRANIKKQLPGDVYANASIHFLRGAIDYSRLSFKHKTMMAFAYRRLKGLAEEERTAEADAIIETYGRNVSFVDFDALNPIIDEIKRQ